MPSFACHSLGKVIKRSGWTIAGQSIHPILIWEPIYQAFVFSVNLYRQAFAKIFVSFPHIFKHLLILHTNIQSLHPNKCLIFALLLILYKIDLTFNLECSLVSIHKPVKLQSQSANGIIKNFGTPFSKWVFHLGMA